METWEVALRSWSKRGVKVSLACCFERVPRRFTRPSCWRLRVAKPTVKRMRMIETKVFTILDGELVRCGGYSR